MDIEKRSDRIPRLFDFSKFSLFPTTLKFLNINCLRINEIEGGLVVNLDLPKGIKEDDLKIDITKDYITVGTNYVNKEESREGENYEYSYTRQSTETSSRLPYEVDINQVSQKVKEGVLEIKLAKKG